MNDTLVAALELVMDCADRNAGGFADFCEAFSCVVSQAGKDLLFFWFEHGFTAITPGFRFSRKPPLTAGCFPMYMRFGYFNIKYLTDIFRKNEK